MKKTKQAPQYFIKIIDEADAVLEKQLNSIGLSLNWLSQNQGKALDETIDRLEKPKQIEIRVCLKFRSISYDYAWAKFRLNNVKNEWGLAELLDYVPDKQMIQIKESVLQTVKKFAQKLQTKFKDIDIKFDSPHE